MNIMEVQQLYPTLVFQVSMRNCQKIPSSTVLFDEACSQPLFSAAEWNASLTWTAWLSMF